MNELQIHNELRRRLRLLEGVIRREREVHRVNLMMAFACGLLAAVVIGFWLGV